MEKKTLKEWWNERSKNQKVFIVFGIIIILGILGGDKSKSSGDTDSSSKYDRPVSTAKICPVCYEKFTNPGYRNIGTRTYCSQRCYVDGDGK